MRKKVVIGNWKMNMTAEEAKNFLRLMSVEVKDNEVEAGVAAPYTSLWQSVECVKDNENIHIVAQNVHFEPRGAYTGEISVEMLKEIGIKHCIIGHSERREHFNETDEAVNKKAKVLLEAGIVPVICIGETYEERESGEYLKIVENRLRKAIENIDVRFIEKIIVAYEPIWAISTSKKVMTNQIATKEQAEEMCAHIRYNIAKMYGLNVAENIRVLYGGSVNEANAKDFFEMPNIDGALVGGASLKPTFTNIIKAAR